MDRFEAAEEFLGVTLDGLYLDLHSDGRQMTVNGELKSANGEPLNKMIGIVAAVYDSKRRVVGRAVTTVGNDDYYLFAPFHLWVHWLPLVPISRVMIYPQPRD